MELTVTQQYDYRLGPIEQVKVEILNDRYGRVTARRWHVKREYAIELATLNPEPREVNFISWRWLGATAVSIVGMVVLIKLIMSGTVNISWLLAAGAIVFLLALSVLFFFLFVLKSSRRIIFKTRFSGLPLVDIPMPLRDRRKGKAFAQVLSALAHKNRARIHHNDDELRAGELRMLRRLSENGAISSSDYNNARGKLLK